MHKYIKVIENVFYIILAICLLTLFLPKQLISREVFILVIGFNFIGIGALGLYRKSILLTRSQPLKYSEDSSAGKAINIVFLIVGILTFIIGLYVILSGVHFTTCYRN